MTPLLFACFLVASGAFVLLAFGAACFVLAFAARSKRANKVKMKASATKPPQRVREPPRFQPPAPPQAQAPVTPRQAHVTLVPFDVFDTMSLPPNALASHEVEGEPEDNEPPVHKPSS